MRNVKLDKDIEIPIIGLGTYSLSKEHILNGINSGYRLIDTAAQYGNESEVGIAIKQSGIGRNNIFLTTKLWIDDIEQHRTRDAFFESLKKLETDYIDLYLVHWPAKGLEEAWLEMEKLVGDGYIRAIGVCNFHKQHFEKLAKSQNIKCVVNQIETHPRFHNGDLIEYCKNNEINIEAWSPFGGTGARMLQNEVLLEIANKHHRTSAQIVLRWHMQRGIIAIPRTTSIERLKTNISIFDFELDVEDMRLIETIDTKKCLGANPNDFWF